MVGLQRQQHAARWWWEQASAKAGAAAEAECAALLPGSQPWPPFLFACTHVPLAFLPSLSQAAVPRTRCGRSCGSGSWACRCWRQRRQRRPTARRCWPSAAPRSLHPRPPLWSCINGCPMQTRMFRLQPSSHLQFACSTPTGTDERTALQPEAALKRSSHLVGQPGASCAAPFTQRCACMGTAAACDEFLQHTRPEGDRSPYCALQPVLLWQCRCQPCSAASIAATMRSQQLSE